MSANICGSEEITSHLMWSVDIVQPNDDRREPKATMVSLDVHLRRRFAGRVRIRWRQRGGFVEFWCARFDFAVDLHCG